MCNNSKTTPHKHAAIIKAWADGAVIECYSPPDRQWFVVDIRNPKWHPHLEYRRRPEQQYDLEKYGVEVGDVWTTHGGDSLVVAKRLSCGVITFHRGTCVDNVHLNKLMFRRGEVNKL